MAEIGFTTTLLAASVLFVLFLAVRGAGLKVCAACAAFTATWLGLLAFFYAGWRVDPVLIAALMGGSVVGISYLLREKLPEEYQLFTLPFLASGFSLVYALLGGDVTVALLVLAALWAIFGSVFTLRTSAALAGTAKKLIECCKNW